MKLLFGSPGQAPVRACELCLRPRRFVGDHAECRLFRCDDCALVSAVSFEAVPGQSEPASLAAAGKYNAISDLLLRETKGTGKTRQAGLADTSLKSFHPVRLTVRGRQRTQSLQPSSFLAPAAVRHQPLPATPLWARRRRFTIHHAASRPPHAKK